MANEISYSAQLQASKNGSSVSKGFSGTLTQAGKQALQTTQDITTAGVQIGFGNITGAPAKLLILNLDPTNYVTIYGDSGFANSQDKLLPGDGVLRSPAGNLWAKANTATVTIQVIAVEA